MAEVVLGLGTSHGPQLSSTIAEWALRLPADQGQPVHHFRGGRYTFDELVTLRASEGVAQLADPAEQQAHADRNQRALDALAQTFAEARIDVAIVVGNDQNECFSTHNVAPFIIHRGETFASIPKSADEMAKLPPGIAPSVAGYTYPGGATYRNDPAFATHILRALMNDGFDTAQTVELPVGAQGSNSIQHAFGFVFRRIMRDAPPAVVPIFVNTHYPPNRPSPARCVAFGKALAAAIASWPADVRVAVIASGGLTHYVIDEVFDRRILAAMERGDMAELAAIDEALLQAGTAELQNWLPVASALNALGKRMTVVDYVPCYRSAAGTGTAMAFATWK